MDIHPRSNKMPGSKKSNSSVKRTSSYDSLKEPRPDDFESIESLDEEDLSDYRKGGYHHVQVGDLFKDGRYRVLRKLGWGHFSTVWLVFDEKTSRHGALKIVKSASQYTDAAIDEIHLLKKVVSSNKDAPGRRHVVELLDSFEHKGPNGVHICMVFEVLGENLLNLLHCYPKGLPISLVKRIAKQTLMALDYLHRECGIIHTDLKPENILVCVDNFESILQATQTAAQNTLKTIQESLPFTLIPNGNEASDTSSVLVQDLNGIDINTPDKTNKQENLLNNLNIKIADLGNACWIDKHFTDDIQTRQYRAPEIIVGAPWNETADMWSLACLVRLACS
ncbi:serine/threonine protein kinase, CMGC, variant 2 [Entomophthora muscae]|uniref:Serine/threonine protein kinase, CMGC, variant 2 n=1 Tax=Entomophthora muscae TaxID=34485 RepID=A0ACC2UIP7_9FUNG|nr:serine/threonine protein kinase, CMGC, variant 2 [Entomophthora muscae]